MSDFTTTIQNMLSNGIALNLDSKEEEEFYVVKLQEFFVEETDFPAYLRENNVIEIEDSEMQIGMEIIIQQSTLYMLPYSQEVFEIFTEVLKFIANHHQEVVQEFRGSEVNKIEKPEMLKQNEVLNEEEVESEEESSSDDDFEWI